MGVLGKKLFLDIDKTKCGFALYVDDKLFEHGAVKRSEIWFKRVFIGQTKSGNNKYKKEQLTSKEAAKKLSGLLNNYIDHGTQIYFEVSWIVNNKMVWIGRVLQELNSVNEPIEINTATWKSKLKKEAKKHNVSLDTFTDNKALSIWYARHINNIEKNIGDDEADAVNMFLAT